MIEVNKSTRLAASTLLGGALLLTGSAVAMAAPPAPNQVAAPVVTSQQVASANYKVQNTGTVSVLGYTVNIKGGAINGNSGQIDMKYSIFNLTGYLTNTTVTPNKITTDVSVYIPMKGNYKGSGSLTGTGNGSYSGTVIDNGQKNQISGLRLRPA